MAFEIGTNENTVEDRKIWVAPTVDVVCAGDAEAAVAGATDGLGIS